MTVSVTGLVAELKSRGTLSADDALAMPRVALPDGRIDPAEAEAIFDLNTAVGAPSREWIDVFVEAVVDFVVHQQHPRGYVDEAKAAWLIARIDRDGRVDTLGELELLVKILEVAVAVPKSLRAYALAQVEEAILTGDGPTRGGSLSAGSITATEVALLRRILFSQGGDGPASVSHAEADMLFRIKDATLAHANDAGWERLFVQGVGNHLMAYAAAAPPSRDEALRLDTAMEDTGGGVLGFVGRMANLRENWRALSAAPIEARYHRHAIVADRATTARENAWLTASIAADGARDPLEAALIAFIEADA